MEIGTALSWVLAAAAVATWVAALASLFTAKGKAVTPSPIKRVVWFVAIAFTLRFGAEPSVVITIPVGAIARLIAMTSMPSQPALELGHPTPIPADANPE